MINEMETSTIRIRLEEIYDLADKRLGDAKENMIMQDIDQLQLSATFILDKLKILKSVIIKGTRFDTALVYRILQLSPINNVKLPDVCSGCNDGYISCEDNKVYACNCDRGKHRHRVEKIVYYNNQALSENMRIQRGLESLTEKEHIIYQALKQGQSPFKILKELAYSKY